MAVTAKDVAEACGVSRITVNRALSGNENVKPETREKILKKAQEMGYVPNLIARSLVNGKSKMIGIVISDIKNLYFSEIVDAITRQARARGYMVCTCTHDSDCQEEKRLIEMMKGYCVDGMILNCVNRGDEFKDWLDKLNMKYVILGYQLLPESYTVGVNENKSVKDVVRFLKAHGYNKQVFVVPPLYGEDGRINIPHYQRASGFQEEEKKQGCDYHILYGNDTNEQALEFLKKNTGEKPVFLCTGEMFAIPMQKFLKKNGYRAPKDYGLMTYDRLMYRFWNEEAIAAVDNHVDQIGTSVANAVIDLIEEKEIPMNIEVPYDLEEGTSL